MAARIAVNLFFIFYRQASTLQRYFAQATFQNNDQNLAFLAFFSHTYFTCSQTIELRPPINLWANTKYEIQVRNVEITGQQGNYRYINLTLLYFA